MGLLVGAGVGAFAAAAIGSRLAGLAGLVAFVACSALGWRVGRNLTREVCSAPDCREPLGPDFETCPRCGGAIAGVIHRAADHYSEAASFRRELAGQRRPAGKGAGGRQGRARKPESVDDVPEPADHAR
jgi:hypothetical protein